MGAVPSPILIRASRSLGPWAPEPAGFWRQWCPRTCAGASRRRLALYRALVGRAGDRRAAAGAG
eukprot:6114623-Pyramimonas_sp.AAC.2